MSTPHVVVFFMRSSFRVLTCRPIERSFGPVGTTTIVVPYAFTSDAQPRLAGTVCVLSGTTRLSTVDVEPGWTAEVRSDGSGNNARTDVRFTQTSTGDRVELIDEPGLSRIK